MTLAEFDEYFMKLALREAEKAVAEGEVPTGCLVVELPSEAINTVTREVSISPLEAKVLSRAHNQTEGLCDATAHAEMLALSGAFQSRGNWRLTGTRVYVTKEPCPMCAGALVLARPDAVIWGVSDPKRGGATVFDIFQHPGINHHPEQVKGVLEEPCRLILRDFFRQRRAEGANEKNSSTTS